MKAAFTVALACALLSAPTSVHAQTLYPTPQRAASQCRGPVVWLNLDTRAYSPPGSRDYGTTPNGAYVCRYVVDKSYRRPAANGH
ncbi:MAG: hypothetical protein ABSD74_07020 [Rhizomicrobium sp.]|jgi:hypothetical protein